MAVRGAVIASAPGAYKAMPTVPALSHVPVSVFSELSLSISEYSVSGRSEVVCCSPSTKSNRESISPTGCVVAGALSPPFRRGRKLLNSMRVNISRSLSVSSGSLTSVSKSTSMGTSVRIVASCREKRMLSALARMRSPSAPFIVSAFSSILSTDPNSAISLVAVFGPTPGHPGMLSIASPSRASRSTTCEGDCMPYFSHISFTPLISNPVPFSEGRYMKTLSVTSWP